MSRPMVPAVTAMVLGIISADAFDGHAGPVLAVSGLTALIAGAVAFMMSPKGIRRTAFLTLWFLLPGFTWLGYARAVEAAIDTPLKARLERSEDAVVTGTIDYISIRQDGYALTVAESEALIGQIPYKADKIIISTGYGSDNDYHVGDLVVASGVLYPCEPATNPGQFDSEMYYRIRGVDGRLYADCVNVTGRDRGLKYIVGDAMYRARKRLSEGIYAVLPDTEAGTLNAILTGDRGMLDEDVKAMYSEGGIAHILSISSLHITLLGMGLFRLLMRIVQRLRVAAAVTVLAMVLYGILTGFSASTGRAVLMLSVSLVGKLLWRGYDLMSAIGTSAFVLLAIQPYYLYDSGFRLSFTAVVGIYAAGRLADVLEVKYDIVRSMMMSAAVWIFTLPIVMNTYFYINPYSVLVNILVLPLMSILLVAGFAAGGIGCTAFTVAGRIAAGPVYYILKLYGKMCETESKLPGSRVITGAPDGRMTALYYVSVAAGLTMCIEGILKKNSKKNKKKAEKNKDKRNRAPMLCLAFIALGFAGLFVHPGRQDVYCAFLDVGQGDSIIIRTKDRCIMMDSGSTSVKNVGKYRVIPFLKYNGVKELDMVIISHPDTDHVNAVIEMLGEGYPIISELVVGANVSEDESIILEAQKAGVKIRRVSAGDTISDEKTMDGNEPEIRVLSPEAGCIYEDGNSASVVLEFVFSDYSMLLTGDSDFVAEERYCARLGRTSYTVLKCAHHGSRYSTSLDMLGRVRPVLTVISCSKYNTYGHPNPNLVERLEIMDSEVFTTPECGMISVGYMLNGDKVTVKSYK